MFIKYRIWKYKLAGVMPVIQNIVHDLESWAGALTNYIKWRNMLPHKRQHLHD
jgi:hypothetical protein